MAVANSNNWSLAAYTITRKNVHKNRTKIPSPAISFLFFNPNSSPSLRADSSACSSPILENEAVTIELSLHSLDGFEPSSNHLPDDFKELNALICNLFKDSETESLGFEYYREAKEKQGFKPGKYTFKLVIRYLIRLKNWSLLSSFCDDLKCFRVLPDKSTCCRLISACVKARKMRIVDNLLEIFCDYDLETAVSGYDFAMKGYNQLHMYSTTVVLHERMKSSGIGLDSACYCHIMEAYLKMGRHEKVISMFKEFEDSRMVDLGPSDFHTQIYWILCESLGKLGKPFEALEFFRDMPKKGIKENHLIYSSLISTFASCGQMKIAEELLGEAEEKKMLRDPALFLKLVLRYIEEGLMEKTLGVVSIMKRVKIRVSDCIFCAIINGYSKKRGIAEAVQVYDNLVLQGCEPGQVTYASILNMYFKLGQYPKAETVFSQMENRGFKKCVVAYSTMIAAYGKMGRTRDAVKLLAIMKERGCEPNVWIYNSLLDMNGKALNLRLVEKTWKEMKRRKILPDRVSYTTVISAYYRAREFEMCMKYYEEFKVSGGKIDRAMAGIMVAVLAKTNRVDEVVELLGDMKREGAILDERFYRSATSALKDAGLQVQVRWLQETFKLDMNFGKT